MEFQKKDLSYPDSTQFEEIRSKGGRITIAGLNYAFGQYRIQVWFDKTGCAPAELTDIVLEM